MIKKQIVKFFDELSCESDGIEGWLSNIAPIEVFNRLSKIEKNPLAKVQLNQLLLLALEAGMSNGFFKYYWLSKPLHVYDVTEVDDFNEEYLKKNALISLEHLRWGLRRIYIDTLLFFGNINTGFQFLRTKSYEEIEKYFIEKRYPTEDMKKRGEPLEFIEIDKDSRYLISEMACKSYGLTPTHKSDLKDYLISSYKTAKKSGHKRVKIKDLFDGDFAKKSKKYEDTLPLFIFSVDEIYEDYVDSEDELERKYNIIAEKFIDARDSALKNTELYLSLVNDLDVYVATSMRNRKDFRDITNVCESIFKDPKLDDLHLRYFDPTLSAAEGHEDKGLIECLMVKCCKVLVYTSGEKESYGKDVEAAMAISLGKPAIFYCSQKQRSEFYKKVHPLSRLIDFSSGVAIGAMVTDKIEDVSELLCRIFENKMQYKIEQYKPQYFKLLDKLTGSVVRLQTNNKLLTKSFWTYYHAQS